MGEPEWSNIVPPSLLFSSLLHNRDHWGARAPPQWKNTLSSTVVYVKNPSAVHPCVPAGRDPHGCEVARREHAHACVTPLPGHLLHDLRAARLKIRRDPADSGTWSDASWQTPIRTTAMIPRPILTFPLSLLTVAAAAFVLYRPETRIVASSRRPVSSPLTTHEPNAPHPPTLPDPTPGVPWSTLRAGRVTTAQRYVDTSHRDRARTESPTLPRTPPTGAARSLEGETFRDVAVRIYGNARFAADLQNANRDQLTGIDQPLPPGTLLRTPRLTSRPIALEPARPDIRRRAD